MPFKKKKKHQQLINACSEQMKLLDSLLLSPFQIDNPKIEDRSEADASISSIKHLLTPLSGLEKTRSLDSQ